MPSNKPKQKKINLALQGGGAHGALTWGVLDRLLEDERIEIEGISGTSAGAMNAVMLAQGITEGGRVRARETLAEFWDAVATRIPTGSMPISGVNDHATPFTSAFLGLMRSLSPLQANLIEPDPLRAIVDEMVDFERLRETCPIKLFVAATEVRTGKLRIFNGTELCAEMLLASACLPYLHPEIEIDGETYWDGGFSGNPAVFPLIFECDSDDIMIVLLHPLESPETPSTTRAIGERIAELGFSATFLREMRVIAYTKQQVEKDIFPLGRLERRLRGLRFHLIEARELLLQLDRKSRYDTRLSFLTELRDEGREFADRWLAKHFDTIGGHSSVDIVKLFC